MLSPLEKDEMIILQRNILSLLAPFTYYEYVHGNVLCSSFENQNYLYIHWLFLLASSSKRCMRLSSSTEICEDCFRICV